MSFERNRTLRIDRGLYILEQRGGRTYAARAWVDGGWKYTNLETTDYRAAEQAAVKWHRGLRSSREGHETIAQAAATYLQSFSDADAGKRANHTAKWEAVREFWNPSMGRPSVVVTDIETPKLLEFVK